MTSLKIYLILGGIIALLGTGFKFYYDYAQAKMEVLESNIEKANLAIESQKKAFDSYKTNVENQLENISGLQERQREIADQTNELSELLARHRLDQLAAGKPGLIERRANAATKRVFNDVEESSQPVEKTEEK